MVYKKNHPISQRKMIKNINTEVKPVLFVRKIKKGFVKQFEVKDKSTRDLIILILSSNFCQMKEKTVVEYVPVIHVDEQRNA